MLHEIDFFDGAEPGTNRDIKIYKDKKGIFQEDIFPCMWWTRDSNNELFSLQDNSYVAVSGRIERYEHEFIIVIELLEYLGIKR